jgi:hypothetical protein
MNKANAYYFVVMYISYELLTEGSEFCSYDLGTQEDHGGYA